MYQYIFVAGDEGFGYSDGDAYTAPENAKIRINRSLLLGTRDSDTAMEIHTQRLKMQGDVSNINRSLLQGMRDSDTAKERHKQRLKCIDVSIDRPCWGRGIRIQRRGYIHTTQLLKCIEMCSKRSSVYRWLRSSHTAKKTHKRRLKMT